MSMLPAEIRIVHAAAGLLRRGAAPPPGLAPLPANGLGHEARAALGRILGCTAVRALAACSPSFTALGPLLFSRDLVDLILRMVLRFAPHHPKVLQSACDNLVLLALMLIPGISVDCKRIIASNGWLAPLALPASGYASEIPASAEATQLIAGLASWLGRRWRELDDQALETPEVVAALAGRGRMLSAVGRRLEGPALADVLVPLASSFADPEYPQRLVARLDAARLDAAQLDKAGEVRHAMLASLAWVPWLAELHRRARSSRWFDPNYAEDQTISERLRPLAAGSLDRAQRLVRGIGEQTKEQGDEQNL